MSEKLKSLAEEYSDLASAAMLSGRWVPTLEETELFNALQMRLLAQPGPSPKDPE